MMEKRAVVATEKEKKASDELMESERAVKRCKLCGSKVVGDAERCIRHMEVDSNAF